MIILLACSSLAEPPDVIYEIRHSDYENYSAAKKDKAKNFDTVDIKQNVSTDIDLIMKAVEYPEYAIENEIEGRVIVKLLVDDMDRVLIVQVHESDNKYLNKSALEAVFNSYFESALDNEDRKIPCYVYIPIRFQLK